jgi:tetratricopeptide (TPR) repeat protein
MAAVLALTSFAAVSVLGRAEELSSPDADLCIDASAPAATRIRACTWMIEHADLGAGNLAVAFNNRGVARHEGSDLTGALADLTEAIRLAPSALSFSARAWVYCSAAWEADDSENYVASRAAYDNAQADMHHAIELDPSSGSLDGLCY